uniref:Uncharacterized protein n=1 Tax=Anopheles culicifacies TaxID=139723 RepID=A0A182MJZ3_9DIPT
MIMPISPTKMVEVNEAGQAGIPGHPALLHHQALAQHLPHHPVSLSHHQQARHPGLPIHLHHQGAPHPMASVIAGLARNGTVPSSPRHPSLANIPGLANGSANGSTGSTTNANGTPTANGAGGASAGGTGTMGPAALLSGHHPASFAPLNGHAGAIASYPS